MKKNVLNFVFILMGFFLMLGLIWFFSANRANSTSFNSTNGVLTAKESIYDFGNVSMAAGKVFHTFKIKNTGSEQLNITKIYTSCMCTEASFVKGDVRQGAFGMLGMSYIPTINQALAPNEEAQIEVVFDPGAHGPAGLGKIERSVFLEKSTGDKLELKITAEVVP